VEFPKEEIEQSIPDRFEQIVATHSGRLAVKTKQAELTYDELNRTANRVSHALLARHGSVEETVLLLLDNGAPMIASIIGALKAAKIYVPLDPSFPILRHREILEDTAAGLIVTDSNNLSLAAELARPESPKACCKITATCSTSSCAIPTAGASVRRIGSRCSGRSAYTAGRTIPLLRC
jgi:non-ribosomal peptide synthetase component F